MVGELIEVRSAAEMHQAVMSRSSDMDVVVMAAAVADYAPVGQSGPEGGERAATR